MIFQVFYSRAALGDILVGEAETCYAEFLRAQREKKDLVLSVYRKDPKGKKKKKKDPKKKLSKKEEQKEEQKVRGFARKGTFMRVWLRFRVSMYVHIFHFEYAIIASHFLRERFGYRRIARSTCKYIDFRNQFRVAVFVY